jgi:hypothetical protein
MGVEAGLERQSFLAAACICVISSRLPAATMTHLFRHHNTIAAHTMQTLPHHQPCSSLPCPPSYCVVPYAAPGLRPKMSQVFRWLKLSPPPTAEEASHQRPSILRFELGAYILSASEGPLPRFLPALIWRALDVCRR